jgi:hypothetical protein
MMDDSGRICSAIIAPSWQQSRLLRSQGFGGLMAVARRAGSNVPASASSGSTQMATIDDKCERVALRGVDADLGDT